jgi:hypothetical protein
MVTWNVRRFLPKHCRGVAWQISQLAVGCSSKGEIAITLCGY